MFTNIMLNNKYEKFLEDNCLDENDEILNKKKYICYTYLSQIQPDRLDREEYLLEKICNCEGNSDDRLIGIAVALNNQLIENTTDIDDILQVDVKGQFEIYILAYKGCSSVEKLLDDIVKHSESDTFFSKIISQIYSTKIIDKWKELPNVNVVYIDENVSETKIVKNTAFCQNTYYIDEDKLFRIAKSNENDYEAILEYTDGFPFAKEDSEGQTYVVLCKADKLNAILKNEDGLIRANMFDANVLAYQGETDVNNEMVATLENNPRNFVLFNNGITIICNELTPSGKTLKISNPQVVNGCQTCNCIYKAVSKGYDISQAKVIVKVIETKGDSVAQGIVKGTNRQNIVYEEAFETIKKFHVDLEEFIRVMNVPGYDKVFYERRSKQYNSDSAIKPYQKINFRTLIQSTIALYMDKVEITHRHESKLVKEFKDILSVEGQSFYPYYVAAFLSSNLDKVFRTNNSIKNYKNYKMHIMFLIQELRMGPSPDINNKNEIEKYCKDFIQILTKTKFVELVFDAVKKFSELTDKWIEKKGSNYRYTIKDNPEFTQFMLQELRGNTKVSDATGMYYGVVIRVTTDKFGNLFGHIQCKPENIYFNEIDNPDMNISYEGKRVSYRLSDTHGRKRAVSVKLV